MLRSAEAHLRRTHVQVSRLGCNRGHLHVRAAQVCFGPFGPSMTGAGTVLGMTEQPIDTRPLAVADGIQEWLDRPGRCQRFLPLQ